MDYRKRLRRLMSSDASAAQDAPARGQRFEPIEPPGAHRPRRRSALLIVITVTWAVVTAVVMIRNRAESNRESDLIRTVADIGELDALPHAAR